MLALKHVRTLQTVTAITRDEKSEKYLKSVSYNPYPIRYANPERLNFI